MFKQDVINHFAKAKTVAKVLGITKGSVSQWGDVIPKIQAMRLERLTNGQLTYDPAMYRNADVPSL